MPEGSRKGRSIKDALSEAWAIGARRAAEAMSGQLREHGIEFEVGQPEK